MGFLLYVNGKFTEDCNKNQRQSSFEKLFYSNSAMPAESSCGHFFIAGGVL